MKFLAKNAAAADYTYVKILLILLFSSIVSCVSDLLISKLFLKMIKRSSSTLYLW